jgi:hypothetical protein
MFVHTLDICFNVRSHKMAHEQLTREEILAALEERIRDLRASDPSEMADACGHVETYPAL